MKKKLVAFFILVLAILNYFNCSPGGSDDSQTTPAGNKPDVSISSPCQSPTGNATIPLVIRFSSDVKRFDIEDIAVKNGTVIESSFQAISPSRYECAITPSGSGVVSVTVKKNAAFTENGSGNRASSVFTIEYDKDMLTVFITSEEEITGKNPVPARIHFSMPVDGFQPSDMECMNAAVVHCEALSDTVYGITVNPSIQEGEVTLKIPRGVAFKQGLPSMINEESNRCAIHVDYVAPGITITASAPGPVSFFPVPFLITFSETVTGFSPDDIHVEEGKISYNEKLSEKQYCLYIEPDNENSSEIKVSMPPAGIFDTAGNPNDATGPVTVDYSNTFAIRPVLQKIRPCSAGIMFETGESGNGIIHISKTPDMKNPVSLTTTGQKFPLSSNWTHKKTITGLEPATTCYFTVEAPHAQSSVKSFTTPFPDGSRKNFRFLVVGDTQNNQSTSAGINKDVSHAMARHGAGFILHVGDHVEGGNTFSQIINYFNYSQEITSMTPIVPVFGNHEFSGGVTGNKTKLDNYFVGCDNTKESLFYSYDYHNIHILVLNTFTIDMDNLSNYDIIKPGSPQYQFAQSDLSAAKNNPGIDHIFVALHVPLYSRGASGGGDNSHLIDYFETMFVQNGVKVVFSGHSHNYQHLQKNYNGHKIIYIISGGGGGKLMDMNSKATGAELVRFEKKHNYVIVDVKENSLFFSAREIMEDGTTSEIENFSY